MYLASAPPRAYRSKEDLLLSPSHPLTSAKKEERRDGVQSTEYSPLVSSYLALASSLALRARALRENLPHLSAVLSRSSSSWSSDVKNFLIDSTRALSANRYLSLWTLRVGSGSSRDRGDLYPNGGRALLYHTRGP